MVRVTEEVDMGACDFVQLGFCDKKEQPRDAFAFAVSEAQYESGHGGYSGTIAEKGSFVGIPMGDDDMELGLRHVIDKVSFAVNYCDEPDADAWVKRTAVKVDDKWGPAGCVELRGKALEEALKRCRKTLECRAFVFFGLASS